MELSCTHCHRILPIPENELPPVGAFLACSICDGVSRVDGQYLVRGKRFLLLARIPKEIIEAAIKEMESLK